MLQLPMSELIFLSLVLDCRHFVRHARSQREESCDRLKLCPSRRSPNCFQSVVMIRRRRVCVYVASCYSRRVKLRTECPSVPYC